MVTDLMNAETYFDHASGTPMSEAARRALLRALEAYGDPLRLHAPGREARRLLEDARAELADALGAQADEIVFTSGGTESVALGIWGGVRTLRETGNRVLVSAVEHPAVFGIAHTLENDGMEIVRIPVDGYGRVDLDVYAAEVRKPGTLLASIQHANQEVGTMQPVAEAARLAREAGVVFHTDACQTAGRLPLDPGALDVDLLSISGRKFGAPAGIGALYVRRGVPVAAYPCGDDRERKRRSGMENTPGVAAMAAALTDARSRMADEAARQWSLTERLRGAIESSIPSARLHGHPTQRVPHLVCFSIPDLDPEVLLMALDQQGFRLGGGSLCSGSAHDPSPVLEAMGSPDTVPLWAATGVSTSEAAVEGLIEILPALVEDLRRMDVASADALARLRPQDPAVVAPDTT
jgi:cysteine desulfurase